MAKPYSNDLRERVIKALEKGISVLNIVELFGVKKSAIYNWKNRFRETGDFKPLHQNQGRKSNLTKEQFEQVRQIILDKPDITLEEIVEELKIQISISALCRIINNKLNLKYKKNTSHRESNKTEKTLKKKERNGKIIKKTWIFLN